MSVPNRHINPVGIDGANNGGNRVHLLHTLVIAFPISVGSERIVETGVILRGIDPHNHLEVFARNGLNGPIARDTSTGVVKETKTIDLPLALVPVKAIANLCIEGVHPAPGSSPQLQRVQLDKDNNKAPAPQKAKRPYHT